MGPHGMQASRLRWQRAEHLQGAGDHLEPGCFVEIQVLADRPELASGRVAEVYDTAAGQQPLVLLQNGQCGGVRPCSLPCRAAGSTL